MTKEDLNIEVGVGAVIIDDDGKLLLAKRGKNVSVHVGLWESPGGGVDFGETFADAAKREAKEELGVEVETIAMLGLVEYIKPEDGKHIVGPAFVCKITSGTPKICEPDKCDEIGWFTIEEALKLPLSKFGKHDIENYRNWLKSQ